MDISVIIVSFNTRELTATCVSSIIAELKDLSHEIIVVDNASSDGSAEHLKSIFANIKIIKNDHNAGFGTACNIGYKQSQGAYILLLNSDATISQYSISTLMKTAYANPEAGLFGPKIISLNGTVVRSCFRFKTPIRYVLHHSFFGWTKTSWHDEDKIKTITKVDWLTGCCVLIRRNVYEETGGFDEKIFLYSEETDLMWQANKKGYQTLFVPAAECTHIGGASTKISNIKRHAHMIRSDLYITKKHYGPYALVIAVMTRLLSGIIKAPIFAICNVITGFNSKWLLDRLLLACANVRYSAFPIRDPRQNRDA